MVSDVASICEELRRSQREVASEAHASPSVATLNLIAYVDDPEYRGWVIERASRLADKHPSRMIVLDATRGDGAAEVTTSAGRGGGSTVLSQRVDLAIGNVNHDVIGSLVRDLSIPETHTVLWWSSAKLAAVPLLDALLATTPTIVVDSSGPRHGIAALAEALSFLLAHPNAVLRDLAYMRLAPWQDMIAQFFDDPALYEDIFSLRRLEIASGSEAEALYLAGWLGSRLSWEVRTPTTFFNPRDGRTIAFERSTVGEPRRVVRVVLATDDSTYTAELCEDDRLVCLSVAGTRAKRCSYTPLQSVDNMSLIERATMGVGADQIFGTTLETVRALLA